MINEVALHNEFWNVPNSTSWASDANAPSIIRSRMLWHSFESCKAFIERFLSCRNPDLFFLTAFTLSKLCYVFITLAKLVQLDLDRMGEDASNPTTELRTPEADHSLGRRMTLAKEADFFFLASKVLEKFTAVATDFVGIDGERDAMWNLSSMMRIIMSAYERQMREKQKPILNAEVSAKELEMAQDRSGAAIDPASYSSRETGTSGSDGTYGSSSLEQSTEIQWGLTDDIVWDQILDNFSMIPLP